MTGKQVHGDHREAGHGGAEGGRGGDVELPGQFKGDGAQVEGDGTDAGHRHGLLLESSEAGSGPGGGVVGEMVRHRGEGRTGQSSSDEKGGPQL